MKGQQHVPERGNLQPEGIQSSQARRLRMKLKRYLRLNRRPSHALRGEEGSALVELAFVVPVMMMIFMGAASFSMALYKLQQLNAAASSAAQVLAARAGVESDPCSRVETVVTASLPGWASNKLTYSVNITDSTGQGHGKSSTRGAHFSCTDQAANMAGNEPVTVTATYDYNWFPIFNFKTTFNTLSATQSALME